MKKFLAPLMFVFFTIVLSGPVSLASQMEGAHFDKGVHYSLTRLKLSPKQFSKGYHAEKKDYQIVRHTSFRKMMRKRHGSRFYRWIQRNF